MAITTFSAQARLQEGLVVQTQSRQFKLTVDEPEVLGGTDTGMNPVELVLCALGSCQAIVARVYAPQFGINLKQFWMELEGDIDIDGFLNKADVRCGFSEIRYNIHIESDASEAKLKEFIAFIGQKCPVGDTLSAPVKLVLSKVVPVSVN
ncbi:MAG: OsmC family protein [Kiritimatiellae bacterium]|nr:OsmC family protein [Kiritimatiellia bacterium]MCO5061124.1 OsmC family protein [Kiritimatiellia bacterium]MCO6400751.1 OsmC family protein [Verrucomicrobiota bacterium]